MKREDRHDWIVSVVFALAMIIGVLGNIILH